MACFSRRLPVVAILIVYAGGACATGSGAGSNTLSPTELKYHLTDRLGKLFYCDPDYWPVARANEEELALTRYAEIEGDRERFHAILQRLGWSGRTEFSAQEKLRIYRESKRLNAIVLEPSGAGYTFRLSVAEPNERVSVYAGVVDVGGRFDVREKRAGVATCPICLPGDTRIDGPHGAVALRDLRPGMLVWSADAAGVRIAVPIARTARVPASPGHELVRLRLGDGREVVASPGHPTADGRALGGLAPGAELDGARVLEAQRFSSREAATYDILPRGGTAVYWANSVLLGSTLAASVAR